MMKAEQEKVAEWFALYHEDREECHRMAANPETLAATLEEMAKYLWYYVGGALAQNPSTPLSALRTLSYPYTREFLQNPILPLLPLEDPSLLRGFVCDVVCAEESAPAGFLSVASLFSDSYVSRIIALHPNTPRETIAQLLQRQDPTIQLAATRALLDSESVDWELLCRCPSREVRLLLVQHLGCPSGLLTKMASGASAEILEKIAAHPHVEESLLVSLSTSSKTSVRRAVAENPRTPSAVREVLQSDAEEQVALAAREFPEVFVGQAVVLCEVARWQFTAKVILEEQRRLTLASFVDYYDDHSDCDCHFWFWWEDVSEGFEMDARRPHRKLTVKVKDRLKHKRRNLAAQAPKRAKT